MYEVDVVLVPDALEPRGCAELQDCESKCNRWFVSLLDSIVVAAHIFLLEHLLERHHRPCWFFAAAKYVVAAFLLIKKANAAGFIGRILECFAY